MSADPKTLQLQQDLVTLGYDPGPIDGLMGSRTRGAAHEAAQDRACDWTGGAIPSSLYAVLHEAAQSARATGPLPLPPHYYDLTPRASQGWTRHARPWSAIKGITLHQTGCPMSEAASRWYSLRAHYGVTRGGLIYRVRAETDFGWHAQSLSHDTIGIEIEGFLCGIDGHLETRPSGPASWEVQRATDTQIAQVKELVRYLKRLVQLHGGQLGGLYAHRQATDDRTADPGSRIWQEIALPLMAELGLSDGGPGYVRGKGQPIPDVWSGKNNRIPYR